MLAGDGWSDIVECGGGCWSERSYRSCSARTPSYQAATPALVIHWTSLLIWSALYLSFLPDYPPDAMPGGFGYWIDGGGLSNLSEGGDQKNMDN